MKKQNKYLLTILIVISLFFNGTHFVFYAFFFQYQTTENRNIDVKIGPYDYLDISTSDVELDLYEVSILIRKSLTSADGNISIFIRQWNAGPESIITRFNETTDDYYYDFFTFELTAASDAISHEYTFPTYQQFYNIQLFGGNATYGDGYWNTNNISIKVEITYTGGIHNPIFNWLIPNLGSSISALVGIVLLIVIFKKYKLVSKKDLS